MLRRHARVIALPACAAALALAPSAAWADRLVSVPAPPAEASGVAAQVGSLLDVSRTEAGAGSDTASAEASVVRVGQEPLLDLGGKQTGDGQTGGSLVDTGAALPARLQVAPWEAAAQGSGGHTRHARGAAAVARADVPDVARAGVLTSESEASHTDEKSSGKAVTDGAELEALDAVDLTLLHSEVASDGEGHSYLVGVNGTELGTADQLGASPLCAFDAPGLLALSCLTASGGSGSAAVTDAAAQVAQITPALDGLEVLNPVAAFTAAASSGTGQTVQTPQAPAAAASEPTTTPGAEASRAVSPAAAESASAGTDGMAGTLARTGTSAAPTAAAAAMVLLGLALRRFRRPATN